MLLFIDRVATLPSTIPQPAQGGPLDGRPDGGGPLRQQRYLPAELDDHYNEAVQVVEALELPPLLEQLGLVVVITSKFCR